MNNSGALQNLTAGFGIGYMIVCLVICVILIAAYWKIFEKAGEAGWKSIVPFYNTYLLTKIATGNGWLFLLILIPGVGTLIWTILVAVKISKAFDKGVGFIIGIILIPYVFYPILGFGGAQYIGPQ
jgi:hypothetical protein